MGDFTQRILCYMIHSCLKEFCIVIYSSYFSVSEDDQRLEENLEFEEVMQRCPVEPREFVSM